VLRKILWGILILGTPLIIAQITGSSLQQENSAYQFLSRIAAESDSWLIDNLVYFFRDPDWPWPILGSIFVLWTVSQVQELLAPEAKLEQLAPVKPAPAATAKPRRPQSTGTEKVSTTSPSQDSGMYKEESSSEIPKSNVFGNIAYKNMPAEDAQHYDPDKPP